MTRESERFKSKFKLDSLLNENLRVLVVGNQLQIIAVRAIFLIPYGRITRNKASLFSAFPVICIVIELGATSTTVARKGWIMARTSAPSQLELKPTRITSRSK